MDEFILKEIKNANLEKELEKIGFDKSYLHAAVDKFQYKNIKIFNLTLPQANILKQTAISVGADCALHRESITAKIDKTNCILGGSFSQLKKIAQKLKKQPFKLPKLADLIEGNLKSKLTPIKLKEKVFDFTRPYLIGVVNITKDSFSDGGDFFELGKAKEHILKLIKDGADIIELGAETTKPFSSPTPEDNQLEKLLPLLEFIKEEKIKIPVSIDTRSANVAKRCLEAGADMINDVSGLDFDKNLANVIAEFNVPIVIQHSKGTPENMQQNPSYENLMDEIFLSLKEKIDFAISKGIKRENIILDAGIGFGKTAEHNFEIIRRIEELKSLKCPIMLGVSRKGLLGLSEESNQTKDIFTLALNSLLFEKGVNFLRVHNVELHKKLLNYPISSR
ncbi:MAG TPA: dihydropteroate synthase [Candidatus Gastranaerophilaceae bacterium]|nr:dihydropteroate synthase [Candidatus Gastranaerophilaceae bacterium]